MINELRLGANFILEILARRYEYERVPEPDLVMDNPDNVREYRDAGLATGNGSSVYLYNMILLSGAIRPGMTVLDLACGPANLLVELARMHPKANFIGIDLSPAMLSCAEDMKVSAGVQNVRFICGDITSLTMLDDQSADIVMSTLSLHHLPEQSMLERCVKEIARVVRADGAVHLMDFASLKRRSTAQYFAYQRTLGLGPFLAKDYENSLRAAFRIDVFNALLPMLQAVVPSVQLHKTAGVPFMVAITSLKRPVLDTRSQHLLAAYWYGMLPNQRSDFEAMRLFFSLDGLRTPHPRKMISTPI